MDSLKVQRVVWGAMVWALATGGMAFGGEKPLVIQPRVPDLEIVDTWDGLMKTAPFIVGGVEIHLGIESKQCGKEGGVLVYCVPGKGYEELYKRESSGASGESLGPLQIEIIRKDLKEAIEIEMVDKAQELRKGPVIFVAAAVAMSAGEFEVRVIDPEGIILAKRKVEVAKGEDAGWRKLAETGEGKRKVAVCSIGAAVMPKYDGGTPLGKVKKLPRYLPEEPDDSLEVSMAKGVVTVKSTRFVEDDLGENWAIRWWVNGKIVEADRAKQLQEELKQKAAAVKLPIKFSFRMEAGAGYFKSKAEDVVEFQLMYSSGGFESVGVMDEIRKMMDMAIDGEGVRVSKRVAWRP